MAQPSTHEPEAKDKPKTTQIIVNGRPREVQGKDISFEQVVELAFGSAPAGPDAYYLITYSKGDGEHPTGALAPGSSVKVKEGMTFNASPANRA